MDDGCRFTFSFYCCCLFFDMLPPVSFYITLLSCQGEGVQLPLEMGSTLPCYKLTPGKNVILLSTPLFKPKCPIHFCRFFCVKFSMSPYVGGGSAHYDYVNPKISGRHLAILTIKHSRIFLVIYLPTSKLVFLTFFRILSKAFLIHNY